MAVLDEIIDGASDDSVSTANLLRKAQVVAHRLHATQLSSWVSRELDGYDSGDEPLPVYRGPFATTVLAQYSGPAGSGMKNVALGDQGAEDWFTGLFFRVTFYQSTAVLEDMLRSKEGAAIAWPPKAIGMWNRWAEEGKVPTFQFMGVIDARQQITRPMVRGVLDSVRNSLLKFSLDLQSADGSAGEKDGPTVTEPVVGQSVTQFVTNVFGSSPVAIGPGATQTTTISVGDIGALLNAARSLGLEDPAALAELTAAAAATGEDKTPRLRGFLARVGSGGYKLAGDVASKVAVAGLTPLVEQFLGVKQT